MLTTISSNFNTRKLYYGFLHVAIIVLAFEVYVLAKQNREFRTMIEEPSREDLKEGDDFYLGELDPINAGSELDTSKDSQLVFVMTTTCPYCEQNVPTWNNFADTLKDSFSIIGISLDSKEETADYIRRQNIKCPVFCSLNTEEFKTQNKTSSVPKTIIRARKGNVIKVWNGTLGQRQLQELSATVSDITNQQHPQNF